MPRALRFLMGIVLVLAALTIGRPAWATAAGETKPGVATSLPAAAAGAIREAFPGSTVGKVREDRDPGLVLFCATVGDDKGKRAVRVSADGVIVTVKREVKVADLPAALVQVIRKMTAGDTVGEVETRAEVVVAGDGAKTLTRLATPGISYEPPEGVAIDSDGRVWQARRRDAGEEVAPGEEGVLEVPGYKPPCVIYLPSDYMAGGTWPLILHLHGSGGSATTNPWLWGTNGKGYILVGLSYAAVKGGGAQGIGDDPASVSGMIRFIDTVRELVDKKYGVDQQRVFLSGFSMGGWGVNYYGFNRAAKGRYRGYGILAAGPVKGRGVDFSVARDRPVLVLNGEQDGNLPAAKRGAPLLEQAGARVTAVVLPGEGHSPDPGKTWPPLAEWLATADKAMPGSTPRGDGKRGDQ